MSKATLKGNASGTGSMVLESPNTNANRVLTLPDGDGEVVRAATPGGMPLAGSDPVVESGSNSDGEWTRLADGTQMCRADKAGSWGTSGSGWYNIDWAFPATFDSIPFQSLTPYGASSSDNNTAVAYIGQNHNSFADDGTVTRFTVFQSGGTTTPGSSRLFAYGRWK